MTALALHTTDLTLRYGATTALDAVDLRLGAGRIHGLLGRNGAGKTSLLSLAASLLQPTSGRLEVSGPSGGGDPFEREALMEQICLIRESGDVVDDEKIEVTLEIAHLGRPTFDRPYAESILAEFGVSPKAKPGALSRGQRSALGAALGLAARAPLTMFDEVHLGMDAPSRQRFADLLIADFAAHPRTVILSTHLIEEVEPLLETVTILDRGRVLLSAEADDLRGRGWTLTGPVGAVDAAGAGLDVIGVRDLGPTRQVTVYGALDDARADTLQRQGLTVGAVGLQDLFIRLTDPARGAGGRDQTPATTPQEAS